MPDNLKPCPFCGADPEITHDIIDDMDFWSIGCGNDDKCPVILVTNDFESKAEAVKAWNTRDYC